MNITVSPHGRTGNRLFQYALGLILAKDKQSTFSAEPIPYFNNIKLQQYIPNNLDTFKTSTFGNNFYDYKILLSLDKNILIDTHVQKIGVLLENLEFLKTQFYVDNTLQNLPEDDELVIHIRETDYKIINTYLGDDFYRTFIKQTNFTKITIITDNTQSPLVQELASQGCNVFTKEMCLNWQSPYFSKNEIDDFNYILFSKHLLLSQSTFSWWAAFLGIPKTVYFPFFKKGGMWPLYPKKDDIDLFYNLKETHKVII